MIPEPGAAMRACKVVILDDLTSEFLKNLRKYRIERDLQIVDVAGAMRIKREQLVTYELNRAKPLLGILIRLAAYYKYDLSGSYNYEYYYHGVDREYLYKLLILSGLEKKDISDLTGLSLGVVREAFNEPEYVSLNVIHKVVKCLREKCEYNA